jgi:ribonuclease E
MAIRVVRDIFNDDFGTLVVQGDEAWSTISTYVDELAPDLAARVSKWTGNLDVFTVHRVDEQLAKGMDRKVWLPSGGSLVIDRTEAMTVIDVNTGKFTGVGGTLEETVTRNNLEAAEEIVGQLRLRDIGGIIVIDFIDMVLESNRDLVLRRLVECLGRDRTKHQVAEVTSLGLVQMTRKRVGQGLVEAFSETCEHCHGRGFIVHTEPIDRTNGRSEAGGQMPPVEAAGKRSRRKRATEPSAVPVAVPVAPEAREAVKATLATIAAAAAHAHEHDQDLAPADESRADEATGHEAGAGAATADVATADVAIADVATADAVSADVARADEATEDVRPADVPAAEAPAPDVPAAEVPAADVPAADGPVADVPVTDVPAADVPATAEATSNVPHQPRVLDVLAELAARMPVGGRHVPDGPVGATPVGDDGEAPALDLVPVDPAVFEWTAPQEAGEAVDEG